MAERHQHYRFIGGAVLQTQRDQKRFYQKSHAAIAKSASTIACFAASASREYHMDRLNILFVFYNESGSSFLKSRRRKWNIHDMG